MTRRQRRPRRNHQQRIGFESLESRQVLAADFGDVDLDLWAWDAGAAAESVDILAESWLASDGWYDDSWWVDDGSWVDNTSWSDAGSWSNDDWWVTANWSGDDSAVGTTVASAVEDVGGDDGSGDDGSGLQTATTGDAGSTETAGEAVSEWYSFAPETTPGPEAASAFETVTVALEPQDVSAETFTPPERSSEPVIEVLWGTVSDGVTDVSVTAETSAGDQDAAVIDAPSSDVILEGVDSALAGLDDTAVTEFDDPVVVVDDPVVVVDDPVAVVDDPVAVVDDPVAVVDDPVAVVDDPVAVVAPTTVSPPPPVAKTQGSAGRSTSWFGTFMQRFGGFSAASDPASLSDSEIPGRGRLRGRLPFRPAN